MNLKTCGGRMRMCKRIPMRRNTTRVGTMTMIEEKDKGANKNVRQATPFALNVPNTGTIKSSELENRQRSIGISTFLLLSGPIRKIIQYLGLEY